MLVDPKGRVTFGVVAICRSSPRDARRFVGAANWSLVRDRRTPCWASRTPGLVPGVLCGTCLPPQGHCEGLEDRWIAVPGTRPAQGVLSPGEDLLRLFVTPLPLWCRGRQSEQCEGMATRQPRAATRRVRAG